MMLYYLFLFLCCILIVKSQTACNKDLVGIDNPDGKDVIGGLTDTYFLACTGIYRSTCCARVTEWQYRAEIIDEVELMIWRNDNGSFYELVAIETVTPSQVDDNSYFPPTDVIIQPGDCLGWHNVNGEVINFKNGGDGIQAEYISGITPTVGGFINWSGSTQTAKTDSEWSINVQVEPSRSPEFPAQTTTYNIPDNTTVGTVVATVTFTDPDAGDTLTLQMTSTPSDYLSFTDNGDGTGVIQTTKSVKPLAANNIDVTFTATDACGITLNGAFTVNVINYPPTLTGLPPDVLLSESITSEVLVTTYTCSDGGGDVSVTTSESSGNDPPFFFSSYINGSYVYGIYTRSQINKTNGFFDYDAQRTYDITIKCSDSIDDVSDTVTVHLQKNAAPVITNLPDTVYINRTTKTGDVIFNVSFTDAEGDQVWLSMSSMPTNSPFIILDSGQVQAVQDIATAGISWDIYVDIADSKNNGIQRTLTVIVTGFGVPLTFVNLPNSLSVFENTAISTSLFKVLYTGSPQSVYMTNLDGGMSLFSLNDATDEITTISNLNYEDLTTHVYPMTIVMFDEFSTVSATVTITIVDVNEPLAWSSPIYRTDVNESLANGVVITDPGFAIDDPDLNDTYSCSMDCGSQSGYFLLSTDCVITVGSTYSLDANLPNTITCNLTAVDSKPFTSTSTLIITVVEDNNYTPTFSASTYSFSLSPNTGSGINVGIVTATDDDIGTYGKFSYALVQSDPSYFMIDAASGLIQTTRDLQTQCPSCSGTTRSVVVTATDTGGLVSTSTIYITIELPTTTSPIVATERYKTFMEDVRNIIWLTLALVLLAIMALVGTFICFKYVCYYDGKCCNFRRETVRWVPRKEDEHSLETDLVTCRSQLPQGGHSWQRDMMFRT